MTELQTISFILLWVVLLVEGGLLFLLYRHVGLLYAGRKAENTAGLPIGTQAPTMIVRDSLDTVLDLDTLLTADQNLFIFGSFSCSPCRSLLFDQDLRRFLTAHPMPAYFITHPTEAENQEFAELLKRAENALPVVFADERVFTTYSIKVTPFFYIVTKKGLIQESTPVENAKQLIQLWQHTKATTTPAPNGEPIILIEKASGR